MTTWKNFILNTLVILTVCFIGSTVYAAKCLYISSYHKGYAWSDGVENGLLPELEGKCDFKQFDMDTKRNITDEFKKEAALKAKGIIDSFKPDVVIVSDDNAVKHLVQPYFKDAALPFVFCGVNWSVDKYGLPYKNVTGMIEVSPIMAMINIAKSIVPDMKYVYYLDTDNTTGQKTLKYYKELFESKGYAFTPKLVKTFDEWKNAFIGAQQSDVVILRNNSGLAHWNDEEAARFALENSKKLSLTESEWMMPVTLLGMTKVAEEQGMWAGKTAVNILKGADPAKIKMVKNRKSNIFVNKTLQEKIQIKLPASLLKHATIIE